VKIQRSKLDRLVKKQESIASVHAIREAREQQWPCVIPQDVILQCVRDYYIGSQWSEPPVCAVCSRYESRCVLLDISLELGKYNMELLRLADPFIIQHCILQSMSSAFTFGHQTLDGLMLEKSGVEFDPGTGLRTVLYHSARHSIVSIFRSYATQSFSWEYLCA
jgi:hypothetical protein